MIVGTLAALALTVAGCAPIPPSATEAHFAHTTADLVFGAEEQMTVNLVFVAGADDIIWSDLVEVSLREDDTETNPVTLVADQFTVARGTERDGQTLGNVTLAVPLDGVWREGRYSFSQAVLTFTGRPEPRIVDVGRWQAEQRPGDAWVSSAGEAVVAAPRCGPSEVRIRNLREAALTVDAVTTPAVGVSIDRVTGMGPLTPEQETDVHFDVRCDDVTDFQIITPRVTVTSAGVTRVEPLDTVSIGFTDITTATIERIAAR